MLLAGLLCNLASLAALIKYRAKDLPAFYNYLVEQQLGFRAVTF